MSEKYTKEDIDAFNRKDRMIVAQTSLDHAIETVMRLGASGIDSFTLTNVKKRIIETAEDYFNWVFDKADRKESTNAGGIDSNSVRVDSIVVPNVVPVPTTTQLKWLKSIEDTYHYSKEQVFDRYGKYPSTKEQAVEAVKILKGK